MSRLLTSDSRAVSKRSVGRQGTRTRSSERKVLEFLLMQSTPLVTDGMCWQHFDTTGPRIGVGIEGEQERLSWKRPLLSSLLCNSSWLTLETSPLSMPALIG